MRKLKFWSLALICSQAALAQDSGTAGHVVRPGIKEVQRPFSSLMPSATFKVGGNADWVLIGDDSVWVAGAKTDSIQRIDPATNKVVAVTNQVPLCTKNPSMVRVDPLTNKISAMLTIGPAGSEGGIAASGDSIWIVTDKEGSLSRIDPATNSVRQKIRVAPGSFNPIFYDGIIWISRFKTNVLTAVDAASGAAVASIPVGPKPRFLTSGGGSIWTLNQGDRTASRIDANSKKLVATIPAGIPGPAANSLTAQTRFGQRFSTCR